MNGAGTNEATGLAGWFAERPRATGIGSWPGTDVLRTCREVFAIFGDEHVPYLPELPGRGVGADLIGRSAGLLVDLPVDLQPSGWRLVSHPGRDQHRAASWMRQDLDVLAEVADGYSGPLKVQIAGPWTLAASLWLPRLERVVVDAGAAREVAESLAAGVVEHLRALKRQVPGARLVLQIDEPSLPAVVKGTLPTASGFGRLRPVQEPEAMVSLGTLVQAARDGGAEFVVIHSCAPELPVAALAGTGVDALSLDLNLLALAQWEALAPLLEDGLRLWAGLVPGAGSGAAGSDSVADSVTRALDALIRPWRRLGLELALAQAVTVSPPCGLASASPAAARAASRMTVAVAEALAQEAAG